LVDVFVTVELMPVSEPSAVFVVVAVAVQVDVLVPVPVSTVPTMPPEKVSVLVSVTVGSSETCAVACV
jgi:hypothetical protein